MPQLKECGSWELIFLTDERMDLPCPSVQHPNNPAQMILYEQASCHVILRIILEPFQMR